MTTQTQVRSTEEALKLALEALERCGSESYTLERDAITAIKEALAQPAVTESHKQEPTNLERHERNVQKFLGTPQPKEPEQEPVPAAMKTVIEAMQQDPDYAWGWHCNIAMSFVDAGGDHYTGNQGAARFMRTLANVEPAHELPFSPPQRTAAEGEDTRRAWVGLTEEEVEACFHHVDEAGIGLFDFAEAVEAKLKAKNERKEKNTRNGGCL